MVSGFVQIVLLAAVAGQANKLDHRALIEKALDEPTTISLDGVPLDMAMAALTDQTGVRIVMSDQTMALAPDGAGTLIQKVDIANMSLRRALAELFGPLEMTYIVADRHIEIVPTPALQRLGRAPDWAELDVLNFLAGVQPGINDAALAALQARIRFLGGVPDGWTRLAEAIRRVGAGPGDETLTAACRQLDWAWSLDGDRIIVGPVQDHIRRQLQRPVSLRKNFRPLMEVLRAVGDVCGVHVRVEPGALAALPLAVQQNFSLNVSRQPAEQVLESISAYTGLGYLIDPEGVLFYLSTAAPWATNAPAGSPRNAAASATEGPGSPTANPYVAKIVVPLDGGRTIEWLIRRDELPTDLLEIRANDLQEMIDALRRRIPAPSPSP